MSYLILKKRNTERDAQVHTCDVFHHFFDLQWEPQTRNRLLLRALSFQPKNYLFLL